MQLRPSAAKQINKKCFKNLKKNKRTRCVVMTKEGLPCFLDVSSNFSESPFRAPVKFMHHQCCLGFDGPLLFYCKPRQCIKSRDITLLTKVHVVKTMFVFFTSHVWV